jgi:predicted AAA+ superfamily ATPase
MTTKKKVNKEKLDGVTSVKVPMNVIVIDTNTGRWLIERGMWDEENFVPLPDDCVITAPCETKTEFLYKDLKKIAEAIIRYL